jgi:hypothetical protein
MCNPQPFHYVPLLQILKKLNLIPLIPIPILLKKILEKTKFNLYVLSMSSFFLCKEHLFHVLNCNYELQ